MCNPKLYFLKFRNLRHLGKNISNWQNRLLIKVEKYIISVPISVSEWSIKNVIKTRK